MTYRSSKARMGLAAAALAILFTLATTVPAEAKFNLKSQLRSNGISLKIVRLDRTDGFLLGLSFSGANNTVVIAPGLAGRLLVQARDSEVVMQRDPATGAMQIISADGDLSYALCIIQAVVTFLSDMTLCESDPACVFASVVELVTNILYCNEASVPTA